MEYVGESWVNGAEENFAATQAKGWGMTVKYYCHLFSLIVVLFLFVVSLGRD